MAQLFSRNSVLAAALCLALSCVTVVPAAAQDDPRQEYVRITFYTLRGCMADSPAGACDYTEKDAAACSKWMPFGTQLMFEDGYVVTCRDRGQGDWYWKGWVDVWAPSWAWGYEHIENPKTGGYGYYTTVTVIRWGWGEE